jgi:hypothetical protein
MMIAVALVYEPAGHNQTKNLTSIVHALATVGEEPVSYKYLEMAAESKEEFSKEFSEESRVESMYV